MLLKEVLESIKLGEDDFITVWYKNPSDKISTRTTVSGWEKYYECDVNSYKEYDSEWVDPITQLRGTCKQYSIEIDWDEVRIIKERRAKCSK